MRASFAAKENGSLVYYLTRVELRLLLHLLQEYPVVPEGFQPLSKLTAPAEVAADAELLRQTMQEQRAAHRRRLDAWLRQRQPQQANPAGYWPVRLAPDEVEWFLQILNDIRVGNWYRAGCPEEQHEAALETDEDQARAVWTMHAAGLFLHYALDALEDGP